MRTTIVPRIPICKKERCGGIVVGGEVVVGEMVEVGIVDVGVVGEGVVVAGGSVSQATFTPLLSNSGI